MTFANSHDTIHFRHHIFSRPKGPAGDEHRSKANKVELTECGPRFQLRLFRLELGAIDMKDVEVEWVLRPYFNKQREALAEPEGQDAEPPRPLAKAAGVSKDGNGGAK